VQLKQRRLKEAQEEFHRACTLLDAVAGGKPDAALSARRMQAYSFLGTVQAAQWLQRPKALESLAVAQARLREVGPELDTGGLSPREIGESAYVLAAHWRLRGRYPEAAEAHARAAQWQRVSLGRAPASREARKELSRTLFDLGECQRLAGRPADAARTARDRLKLWPDDPDEVHDVACELCRCAVTVGKGKEKLTPAEQAERQGYLDEALQVLGRAVKLGLKGAQQVRATADLKPLSGRAEFHRLVEEMEKRQRP
jgi:tetratricopeptide (TPR) repeat protein